MATSDAKHILVVDDDPKVRLLLRRCFESEGYGVSEAGSGGEARARLDAARFDLVTLDLGLPDGDGLALARELRARSGVAIVMVTGKGETIDRVVGLEVGADDYIAKPFHVREVLARVRAVLRRSAGGTPPGPPEQGGGDVIAFDGWRLDLARRELADEKGGHRELTTSEFELLKLFAANPGRVLSRDHIMDRIRGHEWHPNDRTIDNLVMRLRRKIEPDPDRPTLIKSVRGVGYTFAAGTGRKS